MGNKPAKVKREKTGRRSLPTRALLPPSSVGNKSISSVSSLQNKPKIDFSQPLSLDFGKKRKEKAKSDTSRSRSRDQTSPKENVTSNGPKLSFHHFAVTNKEAFILPACQFPRIPRDGSTSDKSKSKSNSRSNSISAAADRAECDSLLS